MKDIKFYMWVLQYGWYYALMGLGWQLIIWLEKHNIHIIED